MRETNKLFNVWSGLGTIIFVPSGILFSHGYYLLSYIFSYIGILFWLIAIHFEFDAQSGKFTRFIAPFLAILFLIIFVIFYQSIVLGCSDMQRPFSLQSDDKPQRLMHSVLYRLPCLWPSIYKIHGM